MRNFEQNHERVRDVIQNLLGFKKMSELAIHVYTILSGYYCLKRFLSLCAGKLLVLQFLSTFEIIKTKINTKCLRKFLLSYFNLD